MFWFNRVDVYVGYSIKDFSKAREILAQQKIQYTYKIVNQFAGHGTMRATFGSFGINKDYENLYYVYVKKTDYEKAHYMINKEIHTQ